jgi:predicted unusual protein kinase regulating ubiquinone biosynthesis (AarF/ABC1/UbiB family)
LADDLRDDNARAVPRGRLARLGVFGKIAGGVAGNVIAEGTRRLASGQRPTMNELLLTPANVGRVTDQLSHLRGAAMKLGQMISLDSGDILPKELTDILARLRDRANHMPPSQLQDVLTREWGKDWRRRFRYFSAAPMAAASIGQVHRATTLDGRDLAIKVQYPGVRDSIDADVDNVATLLRVSGLMPKEINLAPLLAEAKLQLNEEADYRREAAQMARFADLLESSPDYLVPRPDQEFTTDRVLAMDFVEGVAIESLETAPQAERDVAMEKLIRLVLREMFEFGLMQTDPNFANYRYEKDSGRLILLDFGASRPVPAVTADAYRNLLFSLYDEDLVATRRIAVETGFVGAAAVDRHGPLIDKMIGIVVAEFCKPGHFDFGDRRFASVLREQAMEMAEDRATWHIPPVETLFVQRKVSGTALLAARLKAKVDIRSMVAPYR